MAYTSFGQWKGATKSAAPIGSFGDFVAQRKADEVARAKRLEDETRAAQDEADASMSTGKAVGTASLGNIKQQVGGLHRMAAAALNPDKGPLYKMGLDPLGVADAITGYIADAPLRHAREKLRNIQARERGERGQEVNPEASLSDAFMTLSNPMLAASKAGGNWLRGRLDDQDNGEELTEEEKALLNPKQDYEGYRGALRMKADEWIDEGRSDADRASKSLTARPDNALLSPLQYAKYIGQQAAINLPSQGIALAGGLATRSPTVYAALSAGPVVAEDFGRRDRLGEKGAAFHSALAGGEEMLGEIIPGKILFGNALKKYASSRMGAAGLAITGESASEAITSGLNSAHKVILDGEPVTITQAFRDAVDAGLIGMAAGTSSGAVAFVTANPSGENAAEQAEMIRQVIEQGDSDTTNFDDDALKVDDFVPNVGQGRSESAAQDEYSLPEEDLSSDQFEYASTPGKSANPARGARTLETSYADKEWEKTFVAQQKAAQRAVELQQKADAAAELARTKASAMVAKRAEIAQRRADEARAIADAKEAEMYDPQANGQQGFRDYLTAPQSSAPAPVNRSKDPYANTAISQDGFRGSLQAKPSRKVKTIAPETAYDAAAAGAVVEPVKINTLEETAAPDQTVAARPSGFRASFLNGPENSDSILDKAKAQPVEETQPSEQDVADNFVFDPYAQDAEIQSSVKLGNRGGELGHESELDYKGPRVPPKVQFSREAPTYLEGLTELGGRDGAFGTPKPTGGTVAELSKSVYPGIKTFEVQPKDGVVATGIKIPDVGETAYIFESADQVWLDVSELPVGGGGEAVYRIASARAQAAGKTFVPDPNGMSPIAQARRPELMLSEGVKHGNFDFLEPGDQVENYSGNAERKSTALAERNIKTVVAAYPEMADIVTDGEKFVNAKTGEVITDAKFDSIAASKPRSNVPDGYRAGSRTLKRAAFLNTFSPGRRETFGVAALEKLRQQPNNGLPKPLQRFLYSRAGASVNGATRERIGKAFDRAFGAGSFGRAVASGRVKLHSNPSEMEGAPSDAQGAYEHKHADGGDVIHLFASNLDESTIAGVVLHEYAHRGFEAAVGGQQQAQKIYDVMLGIAKRDAEMKAAYDRAVAQVGAENTTEVAQETLSYFLENRENKGVPNALYESIAAGVRKGLRAIGVKLKESDGEFKRRVMDIARTSLKAQVNSESAAPKIQFSTKEQKNAERRAQGEAAINPKIRRTDFSGFNAIDAWHKDLKEKLLDGTRFLKEIKDWQIVQGTYSVDTDIHMKLNTFKDAIAGQSFHMKARQYNFIKQIQAANLTARDVGIWAAIKYKDAADKISGQPNGSGITAEFAAKEYERLEKHKDLLDKFVKVITDNHKEALEIRKKLLTKAEYDTRTSNPDYVALRGNDYKGEHDRIDLAVPGTRDLNILGKEYKADHARDSAPNYEDIIAHSFADIEQSRVRAAWNDVALTIAKFAVANPDNPFVKFHPPTRSVVRNPITGVDEIRHTKPTLDKSFINFKNDGIPYTIQMVNKRFENAIHAKVAEKKLLERVTGPLMGRFQGAVLKTANFIGIQKLRDAQEISLYLSLHFGPKVAARSLVLHKKAFGAFQRVLRDEADMSNPTDVALKKWLDGGGLTQIASPESVAVITERIRKNLAPVGFVGGAKGAADSIKSYMSNDVMSDGNFLNSLRDMIDAAEQGFNKTKVNELGEFLEKYQTIGENIGRFTAYQAILEANPNMSHKTAIWHSKEAGANFSVRGKWAGSIGAVVPFYNAIAAGALANKNYFNELRKNKKALAAFGVAVGVAVTAGLSNAGAEDEDGNLIALNSTAAERAGNFILVIRGKVYKWPLPQGAVAAINMVAQSVGPMARLIAKGDEKGQARLYEDIFNGVMKNMGPDISMSGDVDLGPLSALYQSVANEDEFGRKLDYRPEDEKWFSDYRHAPTEHFLENFVPGYIKEVKKAGEAVYNAGVRADAMGTDYATNKALEDVRGLPLFKIFLATASGKNQAANRILYDVKDAIDEEKKRIKKIIVDEDIDTARDELDASPLLSDSTMASNGNITVKGDGVAGRATAVLKEIRQLRALKKRWYNGKDEFNNDLMDATADVVDTSDIDTDNYSNYRKMVMEKLRSKSDRLTQQYKDN